MADIDLLQGNMPSLQGTSTPLQGGGLNLQGSTPTLQAQPAPIQATPAPAPQAQPTPKTVAPKAVITSNKAREATTENQKNLTETIQAITPQTYNLMNETVDVDPNTGKVFGVRPNQQTAQPTQTPTPTPTEQKQVKTDATGNTTTTTTTTGTPKPETIETPDQKAAREENEAITKETEQFNSLIDSRIMKNDATTETMLSAIKQKYAKQRAEMQKYNDAVIGGTNTLGIRSGRQRYASEIQQGILNEEIRQGGLRLAEIDQAESNAIFQAQQANEDKNFALLNEKMKNAKEARTEKRQITQDLYKKTLELEKLAFQRSQEDRAVRELDLKEEQFALSVQNTLQDNSRQALATILTNFGGLAFEDLNPESQAQLDELAKSVGIPTGILRSGMQTIKERQMMQQVLQFGEKQALEQQKLQALQAQRDIQNQIAMMHVAIAQGNLAIRAQEASGGGNPGGYTSKQLTAITKLNENISKNSTYAKTSSMRTYADNVLTALSAENGLSDIAAINQFQKVIDEGAVTRDQDVKLIQDANSLVGKLKGKIKKLETGDQLTNEQRSQMKSLIESLYTAQIKALNNDPYIKAKTNEANLNGFKLEDTILGELGSFEAPASTTTNTNLDDLF